MARGQGVRRCRQRVRGVSHALAVTVTGVQAMVVT
jgi:hypothetical protein